MNSEKTGRLNIDDKTLAKHVIKRYFENGAKPKIVIIEYARALELEIETLKEKLTKK